MPGCVCAEQVAIDGGLCQRCGQELGYIVHHKIWLTLKILTIRISR